MQIKISNPQQRYDFEKGGVPAQWGSNTTGPRLWGSENGNIVLGDKPTALAVSPDGALIAVAVVSVILIYDAVMLTLQKTLRGHKGHISHLEFHPDGNVLVSSSERWGMHSEEAVRLWHVDREEDSGDIGPFVDRLMNASAEEFIKNRGWLAEEVDVIAPAMRQGLADVVRAAESRRPAKNGMEEIASRGLYSIESSNEHVPGFGTQAFSNNGNFLFYVSHHDIVVYDVKHRKERQRLRGHKDSIMWVGSSPDNRLLASTSWDGTVKLWRLDNGALVNTFSCGRAQVWAGKFSPDGQILAASTGNGEVYMWNVYTKKLFRKLTGDAHWVRALDFTTAPLGDGDGRDALYLATGGDTVHVFEARKGKRVQTWKPNSPHAGFGYEIIKVKFLKGNNSLLGVKAPDGEFVVYDGINNVKWAFEPPSVSRSGFNQDGPFVFNPITRSIISADPDNTVRIWNF